MQSSSRAVFEINALRVSCPLELLGLSSRPIRKQSPATDPESIDEYTLRRLRSTLLKFRVLPRAPEKAHPCSAAALLSATSNTVPPERPYEVDLLADGPKPYRNGLAYFKATVCIRFSQEICFQVLYGDVKVLLQGNLKAHQDSPDSLPPPPPNPASPRETKVAGVSHPIPRPPSPPLPTSSRSPLKTLPPPPPPLVPLPPHPCCGDLPLQDDRSLPPQQQGQQRTTTLPKQPEVKLYIGGRLIQRKSGYGSSASLSSIKEEEDSGDDQSKQRDNLVGAPPMSIRSNNKEVPIPTTSAPLLQHHHRPHSSTLNWPIPPPISEIETEGSKHGAQSDDEDYDAYAGTSLSDDSDVGSEDESDPSQHDQTMFNN
eukprot:CAMPEP_0184352718 /NCGR_PEP_ID=MMETSP1089-20130417/69401_1 /TAXON_ID=38269 ORGANISM="Gloeochaete wittrockiana, Strain SAG46.84" /NCGR_SAMPLE_ID=MMETSP1089 /ASSEMBLY_ACC=CAM_ASM_000445 /LENGTH=370 /DNA_ID=CAMNT_0026687535 /DNA_START=221 /DNA_END=1330 /DNA_ORIENTATION=-